MSKPISRHSKTVSSGDLGSGAGVTSSVSTPLTANAAVASSTTPNSSASTTKTFDLRVPKKLDRKVFVSKFALAGIDFNQWKKNPPEFVRDGQEEETGSKADDDSKHNAKIGAGSEYGKEKREEARRRKYARRKTNDDSPWIMTDTSNNNKKYRGSREGGVQENSAYYVFSTVGGRIEAYPVSEWYNFIPVQRYKTLDAEEAEEAFGRRDKVFNYFNLMYKKRLGKSDEDEEGGGGEGGNGVAAAGLVSGKRKSGLKISDGDDELVGEISDSEGEEGEAGDTEAVKAGEKKSTGKGKKKKGPKKSNKRKTARDGEEDVLGEPGEESDDGDYETRELDYQSSDDEDGTEKPEDNDTVLKGVDEEVEEMAEEDEDDAEDKEATEKEKLDVTVEEAGGSESDNEEEDIDALANSIIPQAHYTSFTTKEETAESSSSKTLHHPASAKNKRKLEEDKANSAKREKLSNTGSSTGRSIDGKIDEEAVVRRYLSRKPFTTKELVRKLSKHLPQDGLNTRLGEIIKRLNPDKTHINGKMYLHLKN